MEGKEPSKTQAVLKNAVRSWPLRVVKPALLPTVKLVNRVLRKLVSFTHRGQRLIEWHIPSVPEWFDHYIDLHYQWSVTRNPLWLERGCFSLLAIREGSRVLELCCGDGFNAKCFYSIRASSVMALDFDPGAIAHARKVNAAPNVTFELCDIRKSLPQGPYDNIVWDAAIEHFTEVEIQALVAAIKRQLVPNGILSGYTLVAKSTGEKDLEHHEYRFESKQDLLRLFVSHFKNVKVFETTYPSRQNLYFYASDGVLPFDEQWDLQVYHRSSLRHQER